MTCGSVADNIATSLKYELVFLFRVAETGVKVWQILPKRAVIYDKKLAKIDAFSVTLTGTVTEKCHIQNSNRNTIVL